MTKQQKKNRRPKILTKELKIRFSDAEFSRLQKIANGTNVSIAEIIRRSCETTKPVTIEDRSALKNLQSEIAKIGNNLNQIARWCNTHPTAATSLDMLQVLQKIENHLRSLNNAY